jgi:hypothetical protein
VSFAAITLCVAFVVVVVYFVTDSVRKLFGYIFVFPIPNSVHTFPPYFSKIHFNIILQNMNYLTQIVH